MTRPVRALALAICLAASSLLWAGPSGAASTCSETADVGWDVDLATVTVKGVIVEVPGCADGEQVGIQLITDDGDRPADGPRGAVVADERAVFDVTDLELKVEPVTGIRVFLVVDGVDVPIVTVTIEQRFFNPAGNEQRGLRQTTELDLAAGTQYQVPSAGTGHQDVSCSSMSSGIGTEVEPQGAGSFQATSAVLHVACYQQVQGTPGGPGTSGPGKPGPPGTELPEVLGLVFDRGGSATHGTGAPEGTTVASAEAMGEAGESRGAAVRGAVLSRTGFEAIPGALSGLLLVLLGAGLVRRFRTTG